MESAPDDSSDGLRVLWIEDNAGLRKSLEVLNDAMDDQVRMVASFEAARAVLGRDGPFDWIVCDYHLRGGSCEAFLAELPKARVVILAREPAEVPSLGVPVVRAPIALVDLLTLLHDHHDRHTKKVVRERSVSGPRVRSSAPAEPRQRAAREIAAPPNPRDPRRD